MAIIFTGAARALRGVTQIAQASMYQAHFRTAPGRRSLDGGQLRSTTHRVTDTNGTVHKLIVISTQRAGRPGADMLIMNASDAAAALPYIRDYANRQRRRF